LKKSTAAVCALLALASCRRAVETPATPAKLTVVRTNFAPSVSFAPFIIAKEEGFFAEEGIDAKIEAMEINSSLLALVSKQLDVFAGPLRPGIFNLIVRNQHLAIVADKGHSERGPCQAEAFVAPEPMAQRIAKKGFGGEKFALGRGGFTQYLLDRLIERDHLDRTRMQFATMPRGGDFLDPALRKIEAVRYLTEPNLTNALESGLKVVADAQELAPGHQVSVIVFGPRLLQDDPELGHRFMRAYLKAVRRYNEGKTPRNVEIMRHYTKLPADLIRRLCWQPISADGRIHAAALKDFYAWGRKYNYIEGDLADSALWDPRYVDAAAKRAAR
jgi:NitT/TauT family transport system substrate-binding protein